MPLGLASIAIDEDEETALVRALGQTRLSSQDHREQVLRRTLFFNTSAAEISKSLPEEFYGLRKDSEGLFAFTSEALRAFTDNMDRKNRMGSTQFGDVYRGNIWIGSVSRNVVVKIWNEKAIALGSLRVPNIYVNEEIRFLKDETMASHPGLVNVIGKCCEQVKDETMASHPGLVKVIIKGYEPEFEGVVYDIDPLDTLHNMIMKDNFSWIQRIKVALRFALLLEFLHSQEKPYVVLNLDPRHILLDHVYNPILFEFGLLSGGIIGELSFIKKLVLPPLGYIDLDYPVSHLNPSCDVYVYGVILIGMMAKKVVKKKDLREGALPLDHWAEMECNSPKSSLVHRSLELESGYYASDASSLTELAMRCMKSPSRDRPSMTDVVNCLNQLHVVKCHLQL